MPWRVRGTSVPWANRSVGVPSCPAQPRGAAPPCAAQSRPAQGMSGFLIRHALHKNGLQRQSGVGTLVSNQEQRAPVVPRINRGSTAGFVPPWVYIGFRLFMLQETRPRGFSSIVWGVKGSVVFWANRPVGVPSCSSPLRPAAPPCTAPPRPACSMSGLLARQVDSSGLCFRIIIQDSCCDWAQQGPTGDKITETKDVRVVTHGVRRANAHGLRQERVRARAECNGRARANARGMRRVRARIT